MRTLIDANVFISYLLPTKDSQKSTTIQTIVEAGFSGQYTIVFPQELIAEIRKKVKEKTYLAKYITSEDVEEFVKLLETVAEFLEPITEEIPAVTRDAKDDYLLAYATVGQCDYLVSGDPDLLVLKKVGKLQIVSPSEFYQILKR